MNAAGGKGARMAAWLLGAVLAGASPEAFAHERSVSYAEIHPAATGVIVSLGIAGRDITRLPEAAVDGTGARANAVIAAALVVSRGGQACDIAEAPTRTSGRGGRERLQWRLRCPQQGPWAITSRLPELLGTAHLCFVRSRLATPAPVEVVLAGDAPRWAQPEDVADAAPRALFETFRLGVTHIVSGTDHLLFVFGLVVVASSLKDVAVVVTAFTLAHMLTLAAAALGIVRPAVAPVEALIALSIALVAVENLTLRSGVGQRRHSAAAAALVMAPALVAAALQIGRVPLASVAGTALFALSYLALAERRPHDRSLRWLVAFAFGLLHGFGFAGVLVEAGFSGSAVLSTLVGFNAGIEAGQLLFVAMVWPLVAALRKGLGGRFPRLVLEPCSVAMLAASVAWYAARAFG